jgi:hypothetical protein
MPEVFRTFMGIELKKKQGKVIDDPKRDALEKTGISFVVRREWNPWKNLAVFCTTGQFEKTGEGYKRHCGPVAVTNVILTLNRKYHALPDFNADEIFQTVSRIGMRRGIYWNMDLFHNFGGTHDFRAGEYLRACLRHYEIDASVRLQKPLTREAFLQLVRRGNLLYMELRHHPVYGNHHLVCIGLTELVSNGVPERVRRKYYLIVADGWAGRPRYLDLDEVGICRFFEIRRP